MKKKSWTKSARIGGSNSTKRMKKLLKKLRAKRGRRDTIEYRKSYAYALN